MKYHTLMVELTTKCNMRCIYCEVSYPHWTHRDMQPQNIQKVIDFVKKHEVIYVCLHGHGEMTVASDWPAIANKFHDAGVKLTTCTNLAKKLSPDEIDTLAKFTSITVSLDAIDIELFQALRRGGDIRHVFYNMIVIQSTASQNRNNIHWIWDVVVCNKNAHELLNICRLGATLGVQTINLCNLVKLNPPIPEAEDIIHPKEMKREDIRNLVAEIERCREFCESHIIELIDNSLLESLHA